MKEYEIMYIVKPVEEEAFQTVMAKVNDVINNNMGKVIKADPWGKKRLAYEQDGITEGLYVLVTFDGMPACVRALDKAMRANTLILRHMIISKGE